MPRVTRETLLYCLLGSRREWTRDWGGPEVSRSQGIGSDDPAGLVEEHPADVGWSQTWEWSQKFACDE